MIQVVEPSALCVSLNPSTDHESSWEEGGRMGLRESRAVGSEASRIEGRGEGLFG